MIAHMLETLLSYFRWFFVTPNDRTQSAQDAISTLQAQIQLLNKKEEYLERKINEESAKALENALSNKAVATAALKRKKMYEHELGKQAGAKLQLEMQVHTIESASLNAETTEAMRKAASALKDIHGNLTIDVVNGVVADVQEQTEIAKEIAEVISAPMESFGSEEDEIAEELGRFEVEALNKRLNEDICPVPAGLPSSAVTEEKDAVLRTSEPQAIPSL
jgi:charged multivesicular body protein 4A/B